MRNLSLLCMLAFCLMGCNHLFYFPDDMPYRKSSDYPFPILDLEIPRSDARPIHAWLMNDSAASKGLILHFHGNAQNLTAHSTFSAWLAEAGYTVLIFDYSGYGKTAGESSQAQLIADSAAVFSWVEKHDRWRSKGLPFVVFAQSLGAAVAIATLGDHPESASKVDLLVVESSFDSYSQVAFQKLKSEPVTWLFSPLGLWLVSDHTRPSDAVKSLRMPKVFVQGDLDEVVPFENGKALYQAAIPPKEFWEIPYGGHTEAFGPGSPYRHELLDRISALKRGP